MDTTDTKHLAEIGIALSAEKDINKILELIVEGARRLSTADGGTLYIVDPEQKHLEFGIFQNESMNIRMGGTSGIEIPFPPVPFEVHGHPNKTNVSSYVALTDETVNIPDLYEAEGFDFSGARKYDEASGYRSKSILVIPMKNHEETIIGVLQLINATDPETQQVVAFRPKIVGLIASLAAIIHKFGVSVDFLRKFRAESVFRCDYKASKLVEPNRDEARAPSGNSSARRGLYICVGAGSQGTVRWDTDGASVMRRAFVRDKTMPGAPRCDEKFPEPGHRF